VASKGFRSAAARRGAALAVALVTVAAVVGGFVLRASGPATASGTAGYWLAGIDGGVFNYGQAPFYGSAGNVPLNNPIVGFVPTPSGGGYWMVGSDGGIFAFGDASFLGSMGGKPLNRPIAAMGATPSGKGYWLVASDGGVFNYGQAPFYGSMAGEKLAKPIVDFAVSPTGRGYWMVTSDGAVYGFGDAGYFGSVPQDTDLSKRIQALAPTPTGRGYWLAGGDGAVFPFGDAGNFGSAAGQTDKRVIDMAVTATGKGYYLVTSNGQVFPYGDASSYGDASRANLNDRITAIAASPGAPPGSPPRAAGSGAPPGPAALQAVDDSADGQEDGPLTIDVVGNDQVPSGDGPLTVQSVSGAQHGRTTVSDNRVLYQPAPDYHGPDTFTYTVADARGATSSATVHVTLAPVDDKPEAVDDAVTITDGAATTIDVVANDRGLGDGVKNVAVVQAPAHGTADVTPEQRITYTPAGGFTGNDTLQYRVTDTDGESSTAKLAVTIGGTAASQVPTAADDAVTVRSGRQLPVDVTSNDTVPGGAREIRFTDAAGAPVDGTEITTAAGGMARRLGTRAVYTAPAGSFTGADSFGYVVVDNGGQVSRPATVKATVVTNKAPQVKDGTVAVPQNRQAVGSIAKLGWDPEKDGLTFVLRSSPAGQLTLKPDGTFLYQAPAGLDVDAFSFVANDGNADSNEGHLNIQITQAGAAPATGSSTTSTTGKPTSGKSSKKPTGSNSRTKSSPPTTTATGSATTSSTAKSSTTTTTKGSTSTNSRSKALIWPVLPLAAAPAISRRRRRSPRAPAR
jgi:Bacterial Ig domain